MFALNRWRTIRGFFPSALKLAEKVGSRGKTVPSAVKPFLLLITYVRADARCGEVARTLQRPELFPFGLQA
jgi:hypothetical protein